MKHGRTVLTVAFVALLVVAAPHLATSARAQVDDGRARLEQELQRTDEIIQKAAEQVRDAGNSQAALLVKQAIETQKEAHNSFRGGRFIVCAAQTRAAREMAQKALAILLRPEERTERVEQELQRTDEMIQAVREEASPDWPETALALLDGAERQQQKAWEFYRAGDLRPALRLTLQVREHLRKLQNLLPNGGAERFRERFEKVAELVRHALREAEDSGRKRRMQLAERAQEMLMRAKESAGSGRVRPAIRQLEQAERLAEQSLRLEGGQGGAQEFDAGMARYAERLEQLQMRLADHPSREASRLMEESTEHHRLAREQAGAKDGTPEQAMAELRIANRLLERAFELVQ